MQLPNPLTLAATLIAWTTLLTAPAANAQEPSTAPPSEPPTTNPAEPPNGPPPVEPYPCRVLELAPSTIGPRTWGCGVTHYLKHGPEYWHWQHVKAKRQIARLQQRVRELRQAAQSAGGGSMYAIRLASSTFGVSYRDMVAVASCETGGTFSPYASNPTSTASGLFQFLDSTWASQGMAGFPVWDPVANALAAARIVAREGWGQWVCKP